MLQLLMHIAPRRHFLSNQKKKWCNAVLVILTFPCCSSILIHCSKPAADGLTQLLPLKMTSCGAIQFQKYVKLSGHFSRCFLWDVCAREECSTLDINNSPSDKDSWREPRRLQIPMWLHDT